MRVNQELLDSFRESRNQVTEFYDEQKQNRKSGAIKAGVTKRQLFLKKYEDLENTIPTFNANDLVYYFEIKSQEANRPYTIANMAKDSKIMKRLQKDFHNEEILLFIEFLFFSGQTYLTEPTINVMASSWINTIKRDADKWLHGEFDPSKSKVSKKKIIKKVREFKREDEEDNVEIGGEWN